MGNNYENNNNNNNNPNLYSNKNEKDTTDGINDDSPNLLERLTQKQKVVKYDREDEEE